MASDPTKPIVGDLHIDASSLASYIVDLPPGGMSGLERAQPGFDEAYQEVVANQATYGARAAIQQDQYEVFVKATEQIGQIQSFLPAARKLVEVLEETEASLDAERHKLLRGFAAAVDAMSRLPGNEDLEARYEQLRAYRSARANKGVKTRKANEAQATTTD